jgi:hypothetical protein
LYIRSAKGALIGDPDATIAAGVVSILWAIETSYVRFCY